MMLTIRGTAAFLLLNVFHFLSSLLPFAAVAWPLIRPILQNKPCQTIVGLGFEVMAVQVRTADVFAPSFYSQPPKK